MKPVAEFRKFRIVHPAYGQIDGVGGGAFKVGPMMVIASWTDGWDHVSVSRNDRCPNWTEMERVKRLFFWPHEAAMQLHVAVSDHISIHPYCLHIWRPQFCEIPLPPNWMVA